MKTSNNLPQVTRQHWRTGRAIIIAVSALMLGACVSQGKYNDLVKERDALLKNVSETGEQLSSIKSRTAEQEAMFSKLKHELSSELDSQKLTIRQMKTGINVALPEDILFPSGSANLKANGREVLGKVSEQLSNTDYQIIVSGYTDNIPIKTRRFPTNWDLAAARATNVVRLLEQHNVPADKLMAASFGENQPISSNDTPEGRKLNRRIEIHLRPAASEDE